MRLLLIEDNKTSAYGIELALSHEGFEVDTVHRGAVVIDAIAQRKPDAIILDVSLPDLNGVAVANLVRRVWPGLPIVFTTGHERFEGLDDALARPRTRMLRKPYEMEHLLSAIREVTRRDPSTDRPEERPRG